MFHTREQHGTSGHPFTMLVSKRVCLLRSVQFGRQSERRKDLRFADRRIPHTPHTNKPTTWIWQPLQELARASNCNLLFN